MKIPNEDLEKPWHGLHDGCSTIAKPAGLMCRGMLSDVPQETKDRETWVPLLKGSYNPSKANKLRLDASILCETLVTQPQLSSGWKTKQEKILGYS